MSEQFSEIDTYHGDGTVTGSECAFNTAMNVQAWNAPKVMLTLRTSFCVVMRDVRCRKFWIIPDDMYGRSFCIIRWRNFFLLENKLWRKGWCTNYFTQNRSIFWKMTLRFFMNVLRWKIPGLGLWKILCNFYCRGAEMKNLPRNKYDKSFFDNSWQIALNNSK